LLNFFTLLHSSLLYFSFFVCDFGFLGHAEDTRNLFSAYRVRRIVMAAAAVYCFNLGNYGPGANSRWEMARTRITSSSKEDTMLNLALLFLLGAIVAAAFGFTSAALAAAGVAKLLLFVFLLLFVVIFATDLTRSGA
jgi:uncharacterized membrane protein YtjA (UPF0391 family)